MNIKRVKVGDLETNCYILTINQNSIIIDPGDEPEKIIANVGNNNVLGILITHSHFDHIGALNELKNKYNTPIYHKANFEEKEYEIGNFKFSVIYTSGHTDDSITIYFKDEKVMFTGDFLFKGTVGRTDLPTGDYERMQESIEKIKKYDKNIKIYPGHGETSKLELEFKNNIYLK